MGIRMSDEVAAQVKDRFDNLANEFDQTDTRLLGHASVMEFACGEFAAEMTDGKDSFRLSWHQAFETCSTSAGLIAGNTNALNVDLKAVDQDYGWQYDLGGNATAPPPGSGRPGIPQAV